VRFLIDNAFPPRLARLLAAAGHDAVHVRDYALGAAKDELILAKAREEDRIVVSARIPISEHCWQCSRRTALRSFSSVIRIVLPLRTMPACCFRAFRYSRLNWQAAAWLSFAQAGCAYANCRFQITDTRYRGLPVGGSTRPCKNVQIVPTLAVGASSNAERAWTNYSTTSASGSE
jgi:hypothetical protein